MLSTSRYAYNMLIEFNRDFPISTNIRLMAMYYGKPNSKAVKLFDVKFNWCDMLQHTVAVPVIKSILVEMTRSSNFPLTCPLKANYTYTIENFIITEEMLPPYAGTCNFSYDIL
ncbi:uncharacterized protein LOC131803629 [Musca domestica]|uniref:Uncharacterized protein LOC131803629 n=1 Tax=Musca domestica TaxID=7370 RepID=A0ABM3V5J3_MUSDO|nr:uncharacterized protein LOC131803629 [Musca domestica]